jgi:hypothetical protein
MVTDRPRLRRHEFSPVEFRDPRPKDRQPETRSSAGESESKAGGCHDRPLSGKERATAEADGPLTRAAARARACALADDQSTVVEIVHPGFNSDPGNDAARAQEIEQYWHQARHRHRPLALEAVSE